MINTNIYESMNFLHYWVLFKIEKCYLFSDKSVA